LVLAELMIEQRGVGSVMAEADRLRARDRAGIRRELIGDRESELRARLEDLEADDLQREILAIRELDQPVERRVFERLPPHDLGGGIRGEPRIARTAPRRIERDLRAHVVGAHEARGRRQHERKRSHHRRADHGAALQARCPECADPDIERTRDSLRTTPHLGERSCRANKPRCRALAMRRRAERGPLLRRWLVGTREHALHAGCAS
jgi:hypothetical protein